MMDVRDHCPAVRNKSGGNRGPNAFPGSGNDGCARLVLHGALLSSQARRSNDAKCPKAAHPSN